MSSPLNFAGLGLPTVQEPSEDTPWIPGPGAYTVTGIVADSVKLGTANSGTKFLELTFNTSHGTADVKIYISQKMEKNAKTGLSPYEGSLQRVNELHAALTNGKLIETEIASLESLADYMKAVASRYTPKGEKVIVAGSKNVKNPEKPYYELIWTGFLSETNIADGPFVEGTDEYKKYVEPAVKLGYKEQQVPTQTVTQAPAPTGVFANQGTMPSWSPNQVPLKPELADNSLPF